MMLAKQGWLAVATAALWGCGGAAAFLAPSDGATDGATATLHDGATTTEAGGERADAATERDAVVIPDGRPGADVTVAPDASAVMDARVVDAEVVPPGDASATRDATSTLDAVTVRDATAIVDAMSAPDAATVPDAVVVADVTTVSDVTSTPDVPNAPDVVMPRDAGATVCHSNGECGAQQTCILTTCDAPGACVTSQPFCPLFVRPVCGCNGQTYSNDCFRRNAGVGLASDSACPVDAGATDAAAACTTPAASCCGDDGDCGRGEECIGTNACTTGHGVCKTQSGRGECWRTADCGRGQTCAGASVCPCGALCLIADRIGRCVSPL